MKGPSWFMNLRINVNIAFYQFHEHSELAHASSKPIDMATPQCHDYGPLPLATSSKPISQYVAFIFFAFSLFIGSSLLYVYLEASILDIELIMGRIVYMTYCYLWSCEYGH